MGPYQRILPRLFSEGKHALRPCISCCWVLILLLMMLGVAACGGGEMASDVASSSGTTTVNGMMLFDPCKLVALDEVEQVLGTKVMAVPDLSAPTCRYVASSSEAAQQDQKGTQKSVLISAGRSDDARQYFAFDQTVQKGAPVLPHIKGIGEDAVFLTLPVGGAIAVRHEDIIYNVTLLDPDTKSPATENILKKLAASVEHSLATERPSLPVSMPHPCQLVTSQEASHSLQDKPVHWLLAINSSGVASCDYVSSLGVDSRVIVMVNARTSGTEELYERQLKVFNKKKTLTGIGKQAFSDGVNTVLVREPDAFFHVTVLGKSDPVQASEQLARLVTQRLQKQ